MKRTAGRRRDRTRPQNLETLECQEENDGRGSAHDEQRRMRNAIGADLRVLAGQGRRIAIAEVRQGMALRYRLREAQRNQCNEDSEVSPAGDQGPHSFIERMVAERPAVCRDSDGRRPAAGSRRPGRCSEAVE
jgi:hypothetical protein